MKMLKIREGAKKKVGNFPTLSLFVIFAKTFELKNSVHFPLFVLFFYTFTVSFNTYKFINNSFLVIYASNRNQHLHPTLIIMLIFFYLSSVSKRTTFSVDLENC